MADKKLNEVTKVTDMAYVPVIMSDGSIGQIAKADLASVVAEQMSIKTIGAYGSLKNYNNATSIGAYRIKGGLENANQPPFVNLKYGMLVVEHSDGVIMQTARNLVGETYTRFYSDSTWSTWQRIDNFGYNTLDDLATGVAGAMGFDLQKTELYISRGRTVVVDKNNLGLYKINQSNGRPFILVYYDSASKGCNILNQSSLLLSYCTITAENDGLVLNNDVWDNEPFEITKVL